MSAAADHAGRISPSEVLCRAAGVTPVSNHVADADTACGMCGVAIGAGEACNDIRKKFDDSFNNRHDLVEGARLVCRHCAAVWAESLWMSAGGVAYTAGDEVVSLWSKDDVARFLLDPPQPPFLVFRKFAKQQHMVWRSPVNWDRSRIFMRLGDEVLSISLERVRAACEAWQALRVKLDALGHKGMIAWTDATLAMPRMGFVLPEAAAVAVSAGLGDQVRVLNSLTAGEWWALDALKSRSSNDPLPPRRVIARADGWRKSKSADEETDDTRREHRDPGSEQVDAAVGNV